MTVADLLDLYRYSDWAHARLCGAVRALPAEAAARSFEGSFASLRDLVAHVAVAESVWLERCRGGSPRGAPEWSGSADAAELCDRLEEIASARRGFLAGLDAAALERRLAFHYFSGKPGAIALGDALFHVANHATYHRGQLASMLRALGAAPPGTDFTTFREETGA